MAVSLRTRADITLDAFRAVSRRGEPISLEPVALERMDSCAASFDALVRERVAADPQALIYGVTTAPGDGAAVALDAERQARRSTRLWSAVSYGEPLPQRVVRGFVLARLANMLGGHAAARGQVAQAVAALLDEPQLPIVPLQGNGGAGEIIALGALFAGLSERLELRPKERMALINGSPCAAALVADIALSGRVRLAAAERMLALSSEVIGAPDEAYGADLEELWGDEHETAALRRLRELRAGAAGTPQAHQAPVSYRILPRVLGALRRAQAAAEQAAAISLRSVSDNPVYIPPDAGRPLGAVFSTGGYHNAQAPAAIDAQAAAWADICQLAERHVDQLFQHPTTRPLLSADEWTIKAFHHTQNWWAEESRALASPSLLSLGGFGQNDVPSMSFLAWRKAEQIGRCLDAALAGLGVVASQALHVAERPAAPALRGTLEQVRRHVAPVTAEPRLLGREAQGLLDELTAQAHG